MPLLRPLLCASIIFLKANPTPSATPPITTRTSRTHLCHFQVGRSRPNQDDAPLASTTRLSQLCCDLRAPGTVQQYRFLDAAASYKTYSPSSRRSALTTSPTSYRRLLSHRVLLHGARRALARDATRNTERNADNVRPRSVGASRAEEQSAQLGSTAVGGAGSIARRETGTARVARGLSHEPLPSKRDSATADSRAHEPATHHVLQALPHPRPHLLRLRETWGKPPLQLRQLCPFSRRAARTCCRASSTPVPFLDRPHISPSSSG
ncbi:hypothetical protein DFH09DRAFT_1355158 [Mycena vulgaris]|nr:hypothetical protein DFH09DRAFT_1355158 [Mycena vulgaris]